MIDIILKYLVRPFLLHLPIKLPKFTTNWLGFSDAA